MASLAPVNAVGIFHKERFHFLKDKICLVMAAVIPQLLLVSDPTHYFPGIITLHNLLSVTLFDKLDLIG